MFEPIHGSAFDITGMGIGKSLRQPFEVVENVCERGIMTKDLGGSATTVEVTNAVCDEIQRKLGGKSPV
jgi:isocitrate/isopropylmalate dehydrogenase